MSIITKKCNKCGEIKPINEFSISRKDKSGRVTQCKECRHLYYTKNREKLLNYSKEHGKEYKKNNRDVVLSKQREFYKNNRDKAIGWINSWRNRNPGKALEYNENRRARKMKSEGKFTFQEWESLLAFYGRKCLCCGRDDVPLTRDHVVPLKLGGKHSIENIQPLCHSCNARKGARTVDYRNKKYDTFLTHN